MAVKLPCLLVVQIPVAITLSEMHWSLGTLHADRISHVPMAFTRAILAQLAISTQTVKHATMPCLLVAKIIVVMVLLVTTCSLPTPSAKHTSVVQLEPISSTLALVANILVLMAVSLQNLLLVEEMPVVLELPEMSETHSTPPAEHTIVVPMVSTRPMPV